MKVVVRSAKERAAFAERKATIPGQVPFGYLKVRFSMMPEKWFGVL